MLTAKKAHAIPPSNTAGRVRSRRRGDPGAGEGTSATRKGEAMERLSGLDSGFLYLETPTLHMHVAMTLVLDPRTVPGGYSFEHMRDLVAARIKAQPVFRRRLVEVPFRIGLPVWVEDPD
ncbi:MAG: hypothetical protein JO368_04870, partial [Acidimicrobiales bacterium]|nr:hypothetical protein [Acidimicrobiales bacterium]